LPQQEIADARFATDADQEVRIGQAMGVQGLLHSLFIDLIR